MPIDWTRPMSQAFEYFEVDPGTWRDRARMGQVTACSVSRDSGADTLGSATLDGTGDVGERYVRVWLVAEQGEERERACLGTFLAQSQEGGLDGAAPSRAADGYTPLVELKEKPPPVGYHVPKGSDALAVAARLASENARAPVVAPAQGFELQEDFVAEPDETWVEYLGALAALAGYRLALDELGRIAFEPVPDAGAMQPVWTYEEGDASVLRSSVSVSRDLYGIPNVVEASWDDEGCHYSARAVNDDPNSPASTVARGREIVVRETNPELPGVPSQRMVEQWAEQRLRELSRVECSVTYTHGYNGVRLGDCVRLDLPRAGLDGVCAVVTAQDISCKTGCPVEETATFYRDLWR